MNRLVLRSAWCVLLGLCVLAAAGYAWGASGTPVPTASAVHDALAPAGPVGARFGRLWNLFFGLCTVVFLAIVGVLAWRLVKGPRAGSDTPPDISTVNRPEPGPRRAVLFATAASVLGLAVLIVASFLTDRAQDRMALKDAVNIEVTANQWWWAARYRSGSVSDEVSTANELHIPVGRPVLLTLRASDVIHSFWVPSLGGKKDLIPGRTALLTLQADRPGTYRGQCAEFCGLQHALMGLVVVAEPDERFEAWLQAQRQPAQAPQGERATRGLALFQSVSCALCHAIQGTSAQGRKGPDLTHLASRTTLAAGTLPNTREYLASWIADPSRHKPGTNMPPTPLSSEDLDALVTYLEGLK